MSKRSWVWKYYTEPENGNVNCIKCHKKLRYDKCTTNLIKHMKVHNTYKENGNENIIVQDECPYEENSIRKKMIDSLITDLIITDLQPLSIVEDTGFVALLQFLDPKYRLPNRKLLKSWISEKYNETKSKVQNELDNTNKVCITTDTWTNINTDSFLTVTCHLIDKDFKLKTYTLETVTIEGNHTSIAISDHLQNVFRNWKLESKIISIVTDNAANMKSAIKQIEPSTTNILCFAHTLNLIVKKSLKDIPDICRIREKCRRLVMFFKHSSVAHDKLQETQNLINIPNHKLIMEVETRWNSTYAMFNRLLEQKRAIVLALATLKYNFELLTDPEWNALEIIIPILQIFFSITQEISSEKNVNLSKIIAIRKQLNTHLNVFNEDTDLEYTVRQKLIYYMEYYLHDIENNRFYMTATLLDPRFKLLAFTSSNCISRAREILTEEANKYVSNNIASTSTYDITFTNNSQSDANDERISLWSSFDNEIIAANKNASSSSTTAIEVQNYLGLNYAHRKTDPLLFWSTNAIQYPILSKCARDYLCIMATSVPSERVFSKAGNILSNKRNRLKAKIVNQILFLNSCKY